MVAVEQARDNAQECIWLFLVCFSQTGKKRSRKAQNALACLTQLDQTSTAASPSWHPFREPPPTRNGVNRGSCDERRGSSRYTLNLRRRRRPPAGTRPDEEEARRTRRTTPIVPPSACRGAAAHDQLDGVVHHLQVDVLLRHRFRCRDGATSALEDDERAHAAATAAMTGQRGRVRVRA